MLGSNIKGRTVISMYRTNPLKPTGAIFSPSALLAAWALLLGACASHTGTRDDVSVGDLPEKTPFERLSGQRYTPDGWPQPLTADVYLPATSGPEELRPAVLLVHGGGWARRSPGDMDGIAEDLARRGLVVFNVAYRFAPDYHFPAQLHDLQQAMIWIADNQRKFGVDVNRIGAYGYSAGGHLVSLLATVSPSDSLNEPWAKGAPRLKAVVSGGTPADLTRWPNSNLVVNLIGAERDDAAEVWAAASPITHVSGDEPPFFLYHGGFDRLVEPEQAKDLQQALLAAGVHAELFIKPLHGHVSMFLFGSAVDQATAFLLREL